ncbi:MAG TPA: hypothetical protein VF469_02555 [Kofleriaceae bacterium]
MVRNPSCLRHVFGPACIAVLVAGCTSYVGDGTMGGPAPDAAAMNVDPTGNWNLTYMLDAGCGQPAATAMGTFTVTLSPQGYAVSAAGVTTAGTLTCTPDHCKLSGMFAWVQPGAQHQQSANLSLDAHGNITGNGTDAVVTMTTTCSITFTAHGTRI